MIKYVYDLGVYHKMLEIQLLKLKYVISGELPELRYNPNRDPRTGQYTTGSGVDVTEDYKKSATPGVGTLTQDLDLQTERYRDEIAFAQWIHNTYGGDLHINQDHSGQKNPDFTWNGKSWELKSISTEKAADSAVRAAYKQIANNPGGIMLNLAENTFSEDELETTVNTRMKRYKDKTVDIMIVSRGRTVKVLRYNKK